MENLLIIASFVAFALLAVGPTFAHRHD